MTYINKANVRVSARFDNDTREVQRAAYAIAAPLHHCVGTPQCTADRRSPCDMCTNAARLVLQHSAPLVATEVMDTMAYALGYRCDFPHPSSD